jgi:putative ABC transport system permease protein
MRSVALYLAVRRLTAARGLLVLLAVVTATALGAFAYAEALADSLGHTTAEKAYIATGSDAQAFIPEEPLPKHFPYPITRVAFSNQNATIDTPTGAEADVMLVDPTTVSVAMHWEDDWGTNPSKLLERLASAPSNPLPVIVTSDAAGLRALWATARFRVHVLGTVKAFPEMAQGIPLVITSYAAMKAESARLHVDDPLGLLQSYVWAKGPPLAVERSLTASSLDAYYPSSIETFLHDPNVLLATRTYAFMRTIAVAAAVLVLLGLLLYLQARQRSQVIASALARRMGLTARGEAVSIGVEVFAILAFAGVIGGGIALAAAGPVVRHIDPLPTDAPGPIFVLPTAELLVAAAGLVLVAALAGLLTTWFAARADVSEELRVA